MKGFAVDALFRWKRYGVRSSSAAKARVSGRFCRIASPSSCPTTARAAANERSIRIAT
jgi:hypothetical protein